MKMQYVVLLIFLLSPAQMQDDSGEKDPVDKVQEVIMLYRLALDRAKKELTAAKESLNTKLMEKQNYTDILQQERAKTEELNRNISQTEDDVKACEKKTENNKNQINTKNPASYVQQINEVEKRIEDVLREKNDTIPLLQKQKEEENAVLNQLNDAKSKINNLKNEKERLLREIEKCQTAPESSTVLFPECSILSRPITFLGNLFDYKSSLIQNLLSGILGLDGKS